MCRSRWPLPLLLPAVVFATACRGSDAPVSEREIIRDTAAAEAGDRIADSSALHSTDSAFTAAVDGKDPVAAASFYSDSAVLMPSAQPLVSGPPAIQAEWTKIMGIPGLSNTSRMTSLVISSSGDLGVTRGWYLAQMRGSEGTAADERGKWVTVWRRENDGAWRVITQMFNADVAPVRP